jgi:uncharacterized repeat protein (TIGR03803 family)
VIIVQAPWILDSAGNLYGTTESGGQKGRGALWKLSQVKSGKQKGTWTEKPLYSFSGTQKDGDFPYAGVVLDTVGNIYGTTLGEGVNGRGTVFELIAPTGASDVYKEETLWNFNDTDGDVSYGSLILDSAGNLYGTTYQGGLNLLGVVFEVNPSAAATTMALSSSSDPPTAGEAVGRF